MYTMGCRCGGTEPQTSYYAGFRTMEPGFSNRALIAGSLWADCDLASHWRVHKMSLCFNDDELNAIGWLPVKSMYFVPEEIFQ